MMLKSAASKKYSVSRSSCTSAERVYDTFVSEKVGGTLSVAGSCFGWVFRFKTSFPRRKEHFAARKCYLLPLRRQRGKLSEFSG